MNLQGRPVIILGPHSNGINEQAAVITRDWGPLGDKHLVNLTVFPDCATPFTLGGVCLHTSEAAAKEAFTGEALGQNACWLAT